MKHLTILLFLLYTVLHTNAQTLVGVRAGLNSSKVNGIGSTSKSFDWEKGYHYGLFLHSEVGDNLIFQLELLHHIRGFNYSRIYPGDRIVSGDTVKLKQETKLHYLDVPLVAKIYFGNIYFEAGPQFGVFLNGRSNLVYELHKNGETSYLHLNRDPRTTIEPFDIGFIAGVGYQFNSGIGLGFRYNQGFREVVRRVNWQKNVSLQASLYYLIGFKAYLAGKRGLIKGEKIKFKRSPEEQDNSQDSLNNSSKKHVGYKISRKHNVLRVHIVKMGASNRSEVQFVFNSVGSTNPGSILMSGSSGVEEQSPLFIGFRDVKVPFKGNLTYVLQSSIGVGSIESNLEFEIKEPGIWRVTITTQ